MSERAKKLIVQTIRAYRVEDGATDRGSYRDLVCDLLHMAKSDQKGLDLQQWILKEGWGMFQEECEKEEHNEIARIPERDLTLCMDQEFEFESSRVYLEQRIKESGK